MWTPMSDPSNSGSLINIGDLAQPATALIEKVSACIGIVYEPTRIIRKAKAEAEADRIRAISRLEVSDLEKRALNRILAAGAKEQERMEEVLSKAVPDIRPDAKPQDLEEDWLTAFFDHVRHVSDDQIQQLWARVLAGEANDPRSYSKRTLALLSNLEKSEAELFTALCTFTVRGRGLITPMIFDFEHQIYAKRSINFQTLSHLDSIGLIQFHSVTGVEFKPKRGVLSQFAYFNECLWFYLDPTRQGPVPLGKVTFSDAGLQLSKIAGAEKDIDFLPILAEQWRDAGARWCSPLLRPTVTVTTGQS